MADTYIHPAALVESDHIGKGTRVWAFAHVMAGARLGQHCNVGDHAFLESGANVGDNVTIKNNVCIWAGVTLEDDVFVGPNATFTNDRHPRSPRMSQARTRYERPDGWLLHTTVERGVSIGANATILPGIRLGRYSMIAAGAVVTVDVPPYALMIGIPARRVADLCRCGNKLDGDYRVTICQCCGEYPEMRCHSAEMETINP
jgi:UDP-2-acetamido-3-amino-2,3-dideoxy-glucuronate N-acetyltransferase